MACVLAGTALALPLALPMSVAADELPRSKGSGNVSDALLVQVRPGVNDWEAADIVSRVRGKEVGRFDESRVRVVSVDPSEREQARRTLLSDPRVQSVEDDAVAYATLTPNDPHWDEQWNMRRVRGTEAWETSRGDSRVIVAVVDTGVDENHPDLRGRVMRGWDFQNDDGNPYDDDGHGTAVATTAAAAGNDRVGIAGMCWRCRILPVKVLNGNGSGTHSNIAAGIRWAAKRGADVINLSIAGLNSTVVMEDAINYALRRGAVVVAAAGNWGSSRKTYPAAYPGVVSVAATNNVDRLYEWSNRGSWVTLAAPGCAFSGRPHSRWAWLCGTSLATPVVSGAVGLMRSVAPNVGRWRVTRLLISSTQRLRISVSHGRLDAARALRLATLAAAEDATESDSSSTPTPAPEPTPSPEPSPSTHEWAGALSATDTWDRETFQVRGRVHVSAYWTGVSDLSIWVQDPDGDVIAHRTGDSLDFSMDLDAGGYTFTVQQARANQVSYRVVISYGS